MAWNDLSPDTRIEDLPRVVQPYAALCLNIIFFAPIDRLGAVLRMVRIHHGKLQEARLDLIRSNDDIRQELEELINA